MAGRLQGGRGIEKVVKYSAAGGASGSLVSIREGWGQERQGQMLSGHMSRRLMQRGREGRLLLPEVWEGWLR